MPRGGPDWDSPDYGIAVASIDLSEIADRLIGFARVDSRGRIHIHDTFAEGLGNWHAIAVPSGIAPVVEVGVTPFVAGNKHVKFDTGTVLDGGSVLKLEGWLGGTKRLGLEAGLFFNDSAPDYQMDMSYRPSGGSGWFAGLKYLHVTQKFAINVGGVYTPVTGLLPLNFSNGGVVPVKLVGDFENGKYVRLLVGEIQYNLDSYSLYPFASMEEGSLTVDVAAFSTGDTRHVGRCKYVVFTKDEP